MQTALLIFALSAFAAIAFFRWLDRPYRHRRNSADDLPKLLRDFGMQLGDGAEIHVEPPGRAVAPVVAYVRGAGSAKALRVGRNQQSLSNPDAATAIAQAIAETLKASGWHGAPNLTVWARGAFDPDYLQELYGDIEFSARLSRWVRSWAARRRARI